MRRTAAAALAVTLAVSGLASPALAQTAPDPTAPWTTPRRPPVCTPAQVAAAEIEGCVVYVAGRPSNQGFPTPPFPQTPAWSDPIPVAPEQWTPVGRGASGPVVAAIQQALVDNTAADLVVDGIYGPITEAAVRAYQERQAADAAAGRPGSVALTPSGVVDVATATALGVLVTFQRGPFPPDGWRWLGWAYNGSAALASWEQLMARNTKAIGPIPAGAIVAHRDILPLFEGFLGDLVAGGYRLREWGAYTFRCTSTTRKDCYNLTPAALSFHAWGAAIDINWSANPLRTYSATSTHPNACDVPVVTDLPQWAVRAAERWGLYWLGYGGQACDNPSSRVASVFRDVHHFEFRGTPALARAIVARNADRPRPDFIPTPTTPAPLRRGDRGDDVRTLQRALNSLISAGLAVDGVFGPITEAAVVRFQTAQGLPATGVVDAATWTALGVTVTAPPPPPPPPTATTTATTAPPPPPPTTAPPPPATVPAPPPAGTLPAGPLRRGSRGEPVRAVQGFLDRYAYQPGPVDGIYGAQTEAAVRRFQTDARTRGWYTGAVDGIWGPQTAAAAVQRQAGGTVPVASTVAPGGPPPASPGSLPAGPLRRGSRGEPVRAVQGFLDRYGYAPGPVDGIYGSRTVSAVRRFQTDARTRGWYTGAVDGIWGPRTQAAALRRLAV